MQAQAKRKAATGKAASKALAAGQVAPGPSPNDPALLDAANKAYYGQVQSDIQAILSEFGGEAFRQESLCLSPVQGWAVVFRSFSNAPKHPRRCRPTGCIDVL